MPVVVAAIILTPICFMIDFSRFKVESLGRSYILAASVHAETNLIITVRGLYLSDYCVGIVKRVIDNTLPDSILDHRKS